MNHSFNVKLAVEHSVEEAIILQHLYFWIQKNAANKKNIHDGNIWTYNSTQAFQDIFPYYNKQKIGRILNKLHEKGLIEKGNYNKSNYDRTLWYAFSKKAISIFHNVYFDFSFFKNGVLGSETPIPDVITDVNTDVITDKRDFSFFPKESEPKEPNNQREQQALEILELFKELSGKNISTNTTGRGSSNVKHVVKALKAGYTLDELKDMVTAMVFFFKDDSFWSQHLEIEYLFRIGQKDNLEKHVQYAKYAKSNRTLLPKAFAEKITNQQAAQNINWNL